jgi:hypothetical protein
LVTKVTKKRKKPDNPLDYLGLTARQKEDQSLDEIFPNLDSRPNEIVQEEKNDIETVQKYFPDLRRRIRSISDLRGLIKSQQFSTGEIKMLKTKFFLQLKHADKVGLEGWILVPYLIESGLLTQKDVMENKESLLNLLKTTNVDIRSESWWQIDNRLENLLSKQDIIKHKRYLFELRRKAGWLNSGKVEVVLQSFIDKGIITEEEYMEE